MTSRDDLSKFWISDSMLSSYGKDIAVGDFDGNGVSDFAISAPLWSSIGENDFIIPNLGKVEIIYSEKIFISNGELIISRKTNSCKTSEILYGNGQFKQFGYAMASSDLDKEYFKHIFIEVWAPNEDQKKFLSKMENFVKNVKFGQKLKLWSK